MSSSILTLVDALLPDLTDLLDATAPPLHLEMAEALYGIPVTDEALLSDEQRMTLVYGTGLSMVITGLDMIRRELQKAEAGPAKAQWIDRLKAMLALRTQLKEMLNTLVYGVDPYLIPPILKKIT